MAFKLTGLSLVFLVVCFTSFTVYLHNDLLNQSFKTVYNIDVHTPPFISKNSRPAISVSASTTTARIYCMVPSHIGQLKLWRVILDGYGKYCDVLKFMIDPLTFEEEKSLVAVAKSKGLSLENYPLKARLSVESFEFDVITSEGNKAKVVVVGMKRRKQYLTEANVKVIESLFGSFQAYNSTFYGKFKFHDIGICSDKKPCRHIWEKVWRSLLYIAENDIHTADFFLKVDDDTFLIPQLLKKFIHGNNLNPNDELYFGHKAFSKPNFFISGVCSLFSRATIVRVAQKFRTMEHEFGSRELFPNSHGLCLDRDGATEERVTSRCLKDVGILPNLAAEIIANRFNVNGFDYYDSFLPQIDEFPSKISSSERKRLNTKFFEHMIKTTSIEAKIASGAVSTAYLSFNSSISDLNANLLTADLILPLGLPFTLTYKRKKSSSGWYWNEKSKKRGDMLNCCSFNAFAIHGYKSSTRMAKFDNYLYKMTATEVTSVFESAKTGSNFWYYIYFILQLRFNLGNLN